jgi:hypothetical protein
VRRQRQTRARRAFEDGRCKGWLRRVSRSPDATATAPAAKKGQACWCSLRRRKKGGGRRRGGRSRKVAAAFFFFSVQSGRATEDVLRAGRCSRSRCGCVGSDYLGRVSSECSGNGLEVARTHPNLGHGSALQRAATKEPTRAVAHPTSAATWRSDRVRAKPRPSARHDGST